MIDRTKHWRGLVDSWERSGLSQSEFCRRRGVKLVTFGWWKRRLKGVGKLTGRFRGGGGSKARGRAELVNRGTAQFVEVALPRTATAIESTSFAASDRYEIALNGGRVIRLPHFFEPAVVVRLVRVLESC